MEDLEVDVEPWRQHVRRLAEEVLAWDVSELEVPVSRELLSFVLGDAEAASRLAADGLAPLRASDPRCESDLIRFLDASGRRPVEGDGAKELSEEVADVLAPLLEKTTQGWDVVPPAPYRRKGAP